MYVGRMMMKLVINEYSTLDVLEGKDIQLAAAKRVVE